MRDETRQRYNWTRVLKRIPTDRGELFLGFTPVEAADQRWQRTRLETLPEGPTRTVRRTIWESPGRRDAQLLVDVTECASATDALESLGDRLEYDQLARLLEGPPDLGYASFQHPSGIPSAVFFARGNVCVAVASFGRAAVEALPMAEHIDAQLTERPVASRQAIQLRMEDETLKVGQEARVRLALIEPFTTDYIKAFVQNGRAARDGSESVATTPAPLPTSLLITPAAPGQVRVEIYAVAAGKEALNGTLLFDVA
jgi:hypothetical protein